MGEWELKVVAAAVACLENQRRDKGLPRKVKDAVRHILQKKLLVGDGWKVKE